MFQVNQQMFQGEVSDLKWFGFLEVIPWTEASLANIQGLNLQTQSLTRKKDDQRMRLRLVELLGRV